MLVVKNTKRKGRGVFTTKAIKKGTVVEESPVIQFDEREDTERVQSSILRLYVFGYSKSTAIALGTGSLYNHSKKPNLKYQDDTSKGVIRFTAKRNIKRGEELSINYFYDPIRERKKYDEAKIEKLNETKESNYVAPFPFK